MKYGNKKVYTEEGVFDSQREYRRWRELKLLEKGKSITDLQRQVRFELIPKQKYGNHIIRSCEYIADFVYKQDGEEVVEDCKGYRTDAYKIKKKLMLYVHGVMIKES